MHQPEEKTWWVFLWRDSKGVMLPFEMVETTRDRALDMFRMWCAYRFHINDTVALVRLDDDCSCSSCPPTHAIYHDGEITINDDDNEE